MDKEEFGILYRKNYRKLFMVAFGYLQDPVLAEEIVHEVFLKIWKTRDQPSFIANKEAYLYKSVVNTSLNLLESEKRKKNRDHQYFINSDQMEGMEDLDKWELTLQTLEKALENLPPQCRKVIEMSKINGMKQKDIAESLNISIKTVKNHVHYGYERLRELLKKDNFLILLLLLSSKQEAL